MLIDVQMVKVRKALEVVGVEVRTEWGSGGWAIPATDKARLRRLTNGDAPQVERVTLQERRVAFLGGRPNYFRVTATETF
jgi:hypothetical protein